MANWSELSKDVRQEFIASVQQLMEAGGIDGEVHSVIVSERSLTTAQKRSISGDLRYALLGYPPSIGQGATPYGSRTPDFESAFQMAEQAGGPLAAAINAFASARVTLEDARSPLVANPDYVPGSDPTAAGADPWTSSATVPQGVLAKKQEQEAIWSSLQSHLHDQATDRGGKHLYTPEYEAERAIESLVLGEIAALRGMSGQDWNVTSRLTGGADITLKDLQIKPVEMQQINDQPKSPPPVKRERWNQYESKFHNSPMDPPGAEPLYGNR